jgi:hypothetical protein
MTMSDILGAAGILATVVFGVWGLVVVLRRHYPGEISFVREPNLALFETIVKNIPELTAEYNKKPVGPGLVLVSGALLNSGTKDISEPMVEGKLTFSVPDGFKWLTGKIVGASPNVKSSLAVEDRNLTFSTGLFRCSEFLRFQAIVEVPMSAPEGALHSDANITKRLDEAIKIEHRIADTRAVVIIDLPARQRRQRSAGFRMRMAVVNTAAYLALISYFCVKTGFIVKGIPADIHLLINTTNMVPTTNMVLATNTVPIEVILNGFADGAVSVEGLNTKYGERLPGQIHNVLTREPLPLR